MKLHQYRCHNTNPYHYNSFKEDLIEWATFVGLHLLLASMLIFAYLQIIGEKINAFNNHLKSVSLRCLSGNKRLN